MMNTHHDITITLPKTTAEYVAMLIDGLVSHYMRIPTLNCIRDARELEYRKDTDDVIAEPSDVAVLKKLVNDLRGNVAQNIHTITIKDEKTGKTHTMETVRTAKDIYEYLEGSEAEVQMLEKQAPEEH